MGEHYLGDGLYVRAAHDQIVLRAPRANGDHWVALEPAVLGALLTWIEQQGEDTSMGWMLACYIAARAKKAKSASASPPAVEG